MRALRLSAAFAVACLLTPALATAQHAWSGLSTDVQIQLATQAAPKDLRAGATVQGWDAGGTFTTLRKGTNELICMAPNPEADRFEVSCHHAGLEKFFARGRELSAAGITGNDRLKTRWQEYEAGTLPIPTGSVNYILTGSGFDAATGSIQDAYLRWVVYTPGATPESTGMSTSPSEGGPWLMFPGTAGAHIMITPARSGG